MNDLKYPLIGYDRHRMGIDGKGVTTLIAGSGCPLSCEYCLNKRILKTDKIKYVTADELYDFVKIDDLYFQATGGGITFGGGEPLLHYKFISEFSKKYCQNWNISVETSLYIPAGNIAFSLDSINNYIVDCKTLDPEIYEKYTKHPIDLMLSNLKILLDRVNPKDITVRVPLIPGFNTEEQRDKDIKTLKSWGVVNIDKFKYVIRESD